MSSWDPDWYEKWGLRGGGLGAAAQGPILNTSCNFKTKKIDSKRNSMGGKENVLVIRD